MRGEDEHLEALFYKAAIERGGSGGLVDRV